MSIKYNGGYLPTVGADGTTLVANSSASTGMSWQGNTAAGKNAVINGGMDIWARGTSVAVAASTTAYTTDRWCINTGANEAYTISRQATGDTTNLPNIQYAARCQRNSGQTGTSVVFFAQSFETINSIPFVGKTVTYSFYARAGANYSAASNALAFYVTYGTGTDQNLLTGYTGNTSFINSSATLTTTWQRFTYSATVPTTATELAVSFAMTPTGTAGANDYFEVTGVQLELGSVATAFSRAQGTLQGELNACQRYYYRANIDGDFASAFFSGNTRLAGAINLPVKMRTNPTTSTSISAFTTGTPTGTQIAANRYYTGNLAGTYSASGLAFYNNEINGYLYTDGWTSPVTGIPYGLYGATPNNGLYWDASAEL